MDVQKENFTAECSTVPKIGDVKDAVPSSSQGCFVIQNNAETTAKFNDTLNQENLEYHNEKTNMGVNILVPSSGVSRFVGWKDKLKPSENVKWYKCALCELKTDDKDVFLRHFKIIHEEKRFFHCKFCKYKCKNESGLQTHIKLIHNINTIKLYNCANCGLKTNDKNEYSRHFKIVHEKEEKLFECIFCKYKSKFKSLLQLHIKQQHSAKQKKIEQVTARLDNSQNQVMTHVINRKENVIKVNLNSDVRTKHQKTEVAEDVQKRIKYSEVLKIEHKAEVDSTLNLSNKVGFDIQNHEEMTTGCDYKSKSKHSLRAHIDLKHNERTIKLYNCPNCDLKTNYKDVYLRHFEIVHVEKEKWFQCVFCEYKAIFRGHLKNHVKKKHSAEQKRIEQMTTQLTDLIGSEKDTIVRGSNSDNTETNMGNNDTDAYSDNSKSLLSKDNLDPSENLVWYDCNLCELRTKDKHVFARHSKIIHDEEKFFHCEFCDYKSKSNHSLRAHIDLKHNGRTSKLYNCLNFDLKTNYKDVFLRHFEIVKWFQCVFCEYKSISRGHLNNHVKHKHSLEQKKIEQITTQLTDSQNQTMTDVIKREENIIKDYLTSNDVKTEIEDDNVAIYNENLRSGAFKNYIELSEDKEYESKLSELKTKYQETEVVEDMKIDIQEVLEIEVKEETACTSSSSDKVCGDIQNNEQMVTSFENILNPENYRNDKEYNATDTITCKENVIVNNLHHDDRQMDIGEDDIGGHSEDSKAITSEDNIEPSEDDSYICDLCELKTEYKDVFLRHFKIIHEEKRFFHCKFCKYKSKDKYSLQAHINSRHNIKPYKCPYCDFKTNYKYSLLQHFERIHKKKKQFFQCAFCQYKSKFKNNLQRHVKKNHKKVESVTARLDGSRNRIIHDDNPTSYKATHLKLEENVIKDNVNSDDVKREIEDNDIVIYIENLRSAVFKSDLETCEDVKYEYKLCELETKCQETALAEDIRIDIKEEEIDCSEVIKIEVKEEETSPSSSLDEVCFDTQNSEHLVTSFNNILNPGNCGNDKEYNVIDAITCEKM